MKKLFDDTLFCVNDLVCNHFFIGGGSWAPDRCPICNGIETITYKDLNFWKKRKAVKLFNTMYKKLKMV